MEQPSGSGASERVAWKYMESLMFLKPSIQPRRTRCNEESVEGSFQSVDDHLRNIEDDEYSSSAATAPKRLKAGIASKIEQFGDTLKKWEESFTTTNTEAQNDEDELFLKTILSMMKDLPNAVKDNYKSEMFNKLLRQLTEGQNNLQIKIGYFKGFSLLAGNVKNYKIIMLCTYIFLVCCISNLFISLI